MVSLSSTGSPMPSVTAYWTVTTPLRAGAVNRTRPAEVVRATAPLLPPPTAVAVSSASGSPSALSRQSGRTGMSSVPPAGTVQVRGSKPSRSCGRGVGVVGARRDPDGRGVADAAAAVVDRVVEAGRPGALGQVDLHRLPVGADRHLGLRAREPLHARDRQQPPGRGRVVVERVQHGRAAGTGAEVVVLGLGRTAVALVLVLVVCSFLSVLSGLSWKSSQLSRRVGWSESRSHTAPVVRSLRTISPRLTRNTRSVVSVPRSDTRGSAPSHAVATAPKPPDQAP